MATELRGRRRRRRLARAAVGLIVSGAVAGGVLLTLNLRPDVSATLARRGIEEGMHAGAPRAAEAPETWVPDHIVAAGDHFRAPQADDLRVGSADGMELTIEPGGELEVTETGATMRFHLTRGAVRSHVRKLHPGERFIINTAQAEIEVRGTRFRVALEENGSRCGSAAVTHVSVSEGVVTAAAEGQESRLLPGDEWLSRCPTRHVAERDRHERGKLRGAASRRPGLSERAVGPAGTPPSILKAQNTLFSSAVRARRDGQPAEALARLDQFLREYPDSSLVESALVQRMRLLAHRDGPAARDAAARYMARFPDGLGRGEAQLLLSSAAPAP